MQQDVHEALTAAKQKRPGIFNPSFSLVSDMVSSYSRRNGVDFVPRSVEILIQSNVDTFAKAYAAVNTGSELDPLVRTTAFRRTEGGVNLSLEEAAVETTSLPFGLAVKGGQFFADFTRRATFIPPVIRTTMWIPPMRK